MSGEGGITLAVFMYSGDANYTGSVPGLVLWGRRTDEQASPPLEMAFHRGAVGFILVAQGAQEHRFNGTVYTVKQGHVLVHRFEASEEHRGAYGASKKFHWFTLDPDAQDLLYMSAQVTQRLRGTLQALGPHAVLQADSASLQLADHIHGCLQAGADPMHCASMIASLLTRILYTQPVTSEGCAEVTQAIAYIQAHISERINIEEVSSAVGVSRSSLQHKFTAVTGESMKKFILSQKIERSKPVLLQSGSVSHTALAFGFDSASHYSNAFEKIAAMRPRAYLRKSS